MNFQAFQAKLLSGGVLDAGPNRSGGEALREAFDEADQRKGDSAQVSDSWVMGAAQWILWGGQRLLFRIFCPHENDPSPGVTVDDWKRWHGKFIDVADGDAHGEECRIVARKAANMMKMIESAMSI